MLMVEGEVWSTVVAVVVFIIVATIFAAWMYRHIAGIISHSTVDDYVFGGAFVWMAGVGVAIGAIAGTIATTVMRQFGNTLCKSVVLILFFSTNFLCEELRPSGVLATKQTLALFWAHLERFGMTTSTRLAVEDFWEYMAFAANTFVFLLVGLQLEVTALAQDSVPILAGFTAMLVGRAVAVYGLLPVMVC